MKTDRELLELAAKAAGYKPELCRPDLGGALIDFGDSRLWWNPLTDDGDALRLAVSLTLELDICMTGIAVRTPNGIKVLVSSRDETNPYVATRRAITSAAAAIGESMP